MRDPEQYRAGKGKPIRIEEKPKASSQPGFDYEVIRHEVSSRLRGGSWRSPTCTIATSLPRSMWKNSAEAHRMSPGGGSATASVA